MRIRSIFFLIIGLLCAFDVLPQKNELLIGTWEFESMKVAGNMPADVSKLLTDMFEDLTITFKSNGQYQSVGQSGGDQGNWKLIGRDSLVLMLSKGVELPFDIGKFNATTMILKSGSLDAVVFRRKEERPKSE